MKSLTAAQKRDMLDMHIGCHPAKILPAGVGGMLKFLVRELRQRRF